MRNEISRLFREEVLRASPYHVGSAPAIRVKLNQNENPRALLTPTENLGGIVSRVEPNRYPSGQPDDLRLALADYAGVPPEWILVTHGSNEFVHSLCLSFIERGRCALIPSPAFSLFRNSVHLFGGDVVEVEATASFDIPVEEFARTAASAKPHLVILPCPNNPTGRDLSLSEIESIVKSTEGMVVVDEAYWEFTARPSAISLLHRYDNLIVMRTLSKAFGLAGIRVGYAVCNPDVAAELLKVRLPFMVSRFDAAIAIDVLRRPEAVQTAASELRIAQAQLAGELASMRGVSVVPSNTNFVLFATPLGSRDVLDGLAARGVLVRDMSGYPRLRGFLRVNAGTEQENRDFLTALQAVLAD